jgi:hypothetical protein
MWVLYDSQHGLQKGNIVLVVGSGSGTYYTSDVRMRVPFY